MDSISFENLLDEFAYKRFCFVIGAGASISSGIESGTQIAEEWLNVLVQTIRKNSQNEVFVAIEPYAFNYAYKRFSEEEIAAKLGTSLMMKCIKAFRDNPNKLSWEVIAYIIMTGVGNNYFLIAKYLSLCKPGYIQNYVSDKLQGKIASKGYHWLARIIEKTWNNTVITTNFDDLLLQAIHKQFDETYKSPVVISHSDIAHQIDFVDFDKQPTIFKIHHDFLLSPKNTTSEVMDYSDDVIRALDRIFANYIPIVIGYAGADDGLMKYLGSKNAPMDIYWTYLNDKPESAAFQTVDTKHRIHTLKIEGFDSLVAAIAEQALELDLPSCVLNEKDRSGKKRRGDGSSERYTEVDKNIQFKSAYDEFKFGL